MNGGGENSTESPPHVESSKPTRHRGPNLPTDSSQGAKEAKRCLDEFEKMLRVVAAAETMRRRGDHIEGGEYDSAYKYLVQPPRRSLFLDITVDVAGLFGGSLLAYAVSLVANYDKNTALIRLSFIAGVPFAVLPVLLKYAVFRRK